MAVGLKVYNDDGILQIDSDFKTISPTFRQTFTGPYSNDGNTAFIGTWYQFTIYIPADVKFLFFGSSTDRSIALFKKSGTSHTFRTSAQGTIEIYGFREAPPVASTGSYVMQLFNESGELTFDSNSNFMKISNAFTVPTSGLQVQSYPVPGRTYAVGLGVYPKQWRGASQAGVPWGVLMSYCLQVGPTAGGGGLTAIASRPWGSAGDPAPGQMPLAPAPTVLIVDVTGL